MMKKITKLTKTLLVAAGLLVGTSAVADPYDVTWDFTVAGRWAENAKNGANLISITDASKQFGPDAQEVASGGVTFNFEAENSAQFRASNSCYLLFNSAGSATTNNVSIDVPDGYRVSLAFNKVSSSRQIKYTVDGGANIAGISANFDYDNTTGSTVTFTFWANNPGSLTNMLNSIRLRDVSSVATHGYTVTAKCGETTIGTWSGADIEEGATYYVPAKAYIYANEKYYVLDDAKYTAPNYGYSQTMGTSDAEFEISYTEYTAGDIIYFAEAETLNSAASYSSNNASAGKRSHANGSGRLSIGTLAAGVYTFDLGTNDNRAVFFRDNDNSDNNTNTLVYVNAGTASGSFILTAETPIVITGYTTSNGGLNQSGDFDYVLVKKVSDITFKLATDQAQHLTFHNAGSGSNAWDNWKMNVYNAGVKVGEVRADWWDDVAAGNGNFTNPYLYSADGGITAGPNVWASFNADTQDADCDFTVSYTGGSLYIIGTMTKGSNIYYVNYTKTGLTGDVAVLLYGNNATLTSISFASTDVNTTYAGPSNAISATVTAAGWATLYTPYALDFSGVTGLEAYTAAVSESTVTLTKVNDVPANTGVVLKAAAKTYDIPVIASSETAQGDLEGNATTATAFDAFDGYTLYILTKDGDYDAQFNPMTSGSLAAGKAYLKISNATPARSLKVVFADETTGINSINADAKAEGVYNMNGQRVANPAKGLYIVNGKKVIIK